jgi:hypothetical protein
LVAFGEGVGKMMDDVATASDVGRQVLGTILGLAEQVGKIAIGAGIAVEGIKKALQSLNPVAAIAAGTALIALAATVRSRLQSAASAGEDGRSDRPRATARANVPEMAEGGRVLSSGAVIVGEEGPELVNLPAGAEVTPHRETKNMLNGIKGAAETADGGLGASPGADSSRIEQKLDEVARRVEEKTFRLRGKDLITSQRRQESIYNDAGM